MSKIKKTPTEAKRDLEMWWSEVWTKYVNIEADEVAGFIRITPKTDGTIHGLADLGVWCSFYDYGIWCNINYSKDKVEILISIH